jgi:phage baseplate assembly protein gpV
MSFIGEKLLSHSRAIARLNRQVVTQRLSGKVAERDFDKRAVRVDLGEDPETGKKVLSPWVRVQATSAGNHKAFVLPSIGEQMYLESEGGRVGANSVARFGTHDDENQHPGSDENEFVHQSGNASLKIKDGRVVIEVGASRITLTEGEVKIEGAKLTGASDDVQLLGASLKHNAKNIGDTHGHITAPPGPHGPPV